MWLRQSTTVNIKMGPAVSQSDAVTEKTALSPTVNLTKAAGTIAARNSATAISHDANGWYTVELNATDTNTLGRLQVFFRDPTNQLPVWESYMVLPAVVYDAMVAGSDNFDVSVVQWNGSNVTSGAIPAAAAGASGGLPTVDGNNSVNVRAIREGTAQAGAAGSITLDSGASATDNLYRWCIVEITGGTGAGQVRIGSGYTGSTKVLLVDENWVTNPDNTSTFAIRPLRAAKLDSNGKIVGVVLVDTITTYTGDTPQTGDSFVRIGATGSGLTSLATAANLAAAKTVVDAIKAVTDLLPNGGALSSLAQDSTVAKASALSTAQTAITAIKAVTDLLPNAGALSSLAQDSTVAKATALSTAQTAITAIKAVTDLLPNAGALSSLAQASALTTAQTDLTTLTGRLTALRAGYLDNLSAGAVALASALATVQADTDDIQTRLPSALVGGRMDSNVSAMGGDTAAPPLMAAMANAAGKGTVDNTAFTATTTIFESSDFTFVAPDTGSLIGRTVIFYDGNVMLQGVTISAYSKTAGNRARITVSALTRIPAAGQKFVVV